MASSLEGSLREQIALYVEGYITASDLNDRLPDTWEMDEAEDAALTDLVMLTMGYLAEYEAGYRHEDDLREALAPHAAFKVNRARLSSFTNAAGLAMEVRVGAGTPLLEVHA